MQQKHNCPDSDLLDDPNYGDLDTTLSDLLEGEDYYLQLLDLDDIIIRDLLGEYND